MTKRFLLWITPAGAAVLSTILFLPVSLWAGPQERLIVTGTGSSIGVMRLMAKAFQKKYPHVAVDVLPSIGSTGGIKAVEERKIDIGLSSRPLKPDERRPGIVEEPYGCTAFVFGVQESNPNRGLTLQEIEDIYAGRRTTWPDGTPLRLVLRPMSDAYSVYLAGISPGLRIAIEKAHAIPGVFVGATDQDAAVQIEKMQGSFGVTSACIVASEKRKIKALPVDGVSPTLANVSSGKYPYAMTMHVVYQRDGGKTAVKDFVDFIFSGPGQKILSRSGHAPLRRKAGR